MEIQEGPDATVTFSVTPVADAPDVVDVFVGSIGRTLSKPWFRNAQLNLGLLYRG